MIAEQHRNPLKVTKEDNQEFSRLIVELLRSYGIKAPKTQNPYKKK